MPFLYKTLLMRILGFSISYPVFLEVYLVVILINKVSFVHHLIFVLSTPLSNSIEILTICSSPFRSSNLEFPTLLSPSIYQDLNFMGFVILLLIHELFIFSCQSFCLFACGNCPMH